MPDVTAGVQATDNWPGALTITQSIPAGTLLAIGTHAVDITVTDAQGNSSTCQTSVTVDDLQPPTLTLPADITVPSIAGGAVVNYTATADDGIFGPITPICIPSSGSTFLIGTTTVTCTATDAAGNQATGSFNVTVQPPPVLVSLSLPGNITVLATSAAGAVVTYTATATQPSFGGSLTFPATCTPPSGATFPIGTTTVNCTASAFGVPSFLQTPATGSFTVIVNVGTPSLLGVIAGKGRDGAGNYFVDLQLANSGTGHARNVTLTALTFRTLTGTGVVTYNAAISGPLPLGIGAIDAGTVRTVRLYLNVPLTVRRFSMVESITLQNVVGTSFSVSLSHAVFP
jgi:hypothetical protein